MKQEILLTEVINMMVISMNLICPSFPNVWRKNNLC